jgi:hypothetical protein
MSQLTLSRLENLAARRVLMAIGLAFIDLFCKSWTRVPRCSTNSAAITSWSLSSTTGSPRSRRSTVSRPTILLNMLSSSQRSASLLSSNCSKNSSQEIRPGSRARIGERPET